MRVLLKTVLCAGGRCASSTYVSIADVGDRLNTPVPSAVETTAFGRGDLLGPRAPGPEVLLLALLLTTEAAAVEVARDPGEYASTARSRRCPRLSERSRAVAIAIAVAGAAVVSVVPSSRVPWPAL